ncbi:response regulator [Flavobacteriales bacterium]|nr:response regulator [Flavobacteriales bacterium]
MIKYIAIDDEPPALDLVKGYIAKTEGLGLLAVFNDPIEGIQFIQKEKVPLLFLDINMPELNGMQVSRLAPEETKVIFTSGYQADALDYLLKPFSYEGFLGGRSV